MSRCSRFVTVLPSGTTWNQMRGALPSGATMLSAPTPPVSPRPMSRRQSSQLAKPAGGGSSSYPSAAAQNRASRSGSAQLMTSWYRTAIGLSLGVRKSSSNTVGSRGNHRADALADVEHLVEGGLAVVQAHLHPAHGSPLRRSAHRPRPA